MRTSEVVVELVCVFVEKERKSHRPVGIATRESGVHMGVRAKKRNLRKDIDCCGTNDSVRFILTKTLMVAVNDEKGRKRSHCSWADIHHDYCANRGAVNDCRQGEFEAAMQKRVDLRSLRPRQLVRTQKKKDQCELV